MSTEVFTAMMTLALFVPIGLLFVMLAHDQPFRRTLLTSVSLQIAIFVFFWFRYGF